MSMGLYEGRRSIDNWWCGSAPLVLKGLVLLWYPLKRHTRRS
jgi:hypothetical protein